MKSGLLVVTLAAFGVSANAASVEPYQHYDLTVGGKPWISTVITPYDPAHRDATYKVFTHLLDFEGKAPITNGIDGKTFPHHRGLFIGWKKTRVQDAEYNFWEMKNESTTGKVTQRHVSWVEQKPGDSSASQSERVDWCNPEGKPFIQETRAISAQSGANGARIIDFSSTLVSVAGRIELRGDLQHAGMQVRLADEVANGEGPNKEKGSATYILPKGVVEQKDNKVEGAWWVCCSAEIQGKRYWIMHMTPNTLSTGQPVYSIRRYARFGAFFEPNLEEGKPFECHFRIAVSDKELDQAACEALYQEYAGAKK
ncbi:MAG: PmoA family protein [Candidatus Hydrogenedentes bacterium]|nr:PmoA family protein [Candidatus Hydrogenedentota bacterium]